MLPTRAPATTSSSSPSIFSTSFGWPIADTRRWRSNDFTTLIGAELHAMGTEVGELWHILAAGLPLDFPAPKPAETGPELAARARAAGAFVAIAHPAWSQLGPRTGARSRGACGGNLQPRLRGRDRSRRRLLSARSLVNEGRRLTAIAVDDAHFRHGEHDAFGGFVEVKAESLDPEALLAALKAGHFYASQGPRLHDVERRPRRGRGRMLAGPFGGAVDGDFARARQSGAMSRAPFRSRQRRGKAWTDTGADKWFRIVAIDAAGRRAWTNPIWIDELA